MPKGRIQIRLSPDVADILNKHGRCEFREGVSHAADCANCGELYSDARHSSKRPTRTEIIEEAVRMWVQVFYGTAELVSNITAEEDAAIRAECIDNPEAEQQAVADRAERKPGIRANRDWMAEHAKEYEGWLAIKDGQLLGNAATIEALQEICDVGDFRNTGILVTQGWKRSAEERKNRSTKEKATARASRKAELGRGTAKAIADIRSMTGMKGPPANYEVPTESVKAAEPNAYAKYRGPAHDLVAQSFEPPVKPCPRHSPKYCEPDCKYRG